MSISRSRLQQRFVRAALALLLMAACSGPPSRRISSGMVERLICVLTETGMPAATRGAVVASARSFDPFAPRRLACVARANGSRNQLAACDVGPAERGPTLA